MQCILLLEPEKCVGCRQCTLSCSFRHEKSFSIGKARNTVLWVHRADLFVPMSCQHCEKPICMDVCPADAISRNEETGAIVIDKNLCDGCRVCMAECPFGAIALEPESRMLLKCDLCDGDPECAKHCLFGALTWLPADKAAKKRKRSGACLIAEVLRKNKEK
jgi:anaerobic carbon-monoxide dehydrogenase iron sulfur subunit